MFHETSFLNYLSMERRFSVHTCKAYQNDLGQFLDFIKNKLCLTSVAEVRHLHIRAWIVEQMQAQQSPRSIRRRLSCLKSYFRFLRKRHLLDTDPMAKVISPRTNKRLPVFVRENQMAFLFAEEHFDPGYEGQCLRVMAEILYGAGLRRAELINLKINDIDFSRQTFRILGKGNKERLVPFAPYLDEILRAFLRLRHDQFPGNRQPWLLLNKKGEPISVDYVYYHIRKLISRVSSDEQRSPHVLRHSFATHLSNQGADLNAIKELLGHASLAATQVYTHNTIEKLKKVYEQAHPKSKE